MAPHNIEGKRTRATLLRRLAEQHDRTAEIFRELAALEAEAGEPDVYGSRAPYAPCPGHSYRWSRERIPTMPGAKRLGGKRGRDVVHLISVADYRAWIDGQSVPSTITAPARVVDVATWVAASGMRATTKRSA